MLWGEKIVNLAEAMQMFGAFWAAHVGSSALVRLGGNGWGGDYDCRQLHTSPVTIAPHMPLHPQVDVGLASFDIFCTIMFYSLSILRE